MTQMTRLNDLVPRRLVSLALLLLLGVGAIAGVEALYWVQPQISARLDGATVSAFDLTQGRNLNSWLSAAFLQLAALVSVLNYLIRRHRVDDYHGHYRIWLWAALCWLYMSVDEGANLHQGFQLAMVALTGTRLVGDGSLWWVLAYLFFLVPVGLRLTVDMRECRTSVFLMGVVALLYVLAAGTHLTWIPLRVTPVQHEMIEEGAELLGHWLLVYALLVHARHLVFDVEGRLPQKAAKPKAAAKSVATKSTDFEPPIVRPGGKASRSALVDPETDSAEDDEEVDFQIVHPAHPTPKPASAPAPAAVPTTASRWGASSATTSNSAAKSAPGKWGSSSGSGPKPSASIPAVSPSEPIESTQQKLTKAERKALRQRLEKSRREREGK